MIPRANTRMGAALLRPDKRKGKKEMGKQASESKSWDVEMEGRELKQGSRGRS